MRKFDIPCPKVELLRKHILVMTFIGGNQKPAPKIKDARLPPEDMQIAYNQMISVSIKYSTHFDNLPICSILPFLTAVQMVIFQMKKL